MNRYHIHGTVTQAFSHLQLLGLAAIIDELTSTRSMVHWSRDIDPEPMLDTPLSWDEVSSCVIAHAQRLASDHAWPAETTTIKDRQVALFSPRAGQPTISQWQVLMKKRDSTVEKMCRAEPVDWLSLRMIGALGQPAYWASPRTDRLDADKGASRWEMKTRNAGEEFISNRLRPLAVGVGWRTVEQTSNALLGRSTLDEDGKPTDSTCRLPTGLRPPGPTDAIGAWCALWGISQFPVAHRARSTSSTAAYVGKYSRGSFVLPVFIRPTPLARIRAIVTSDHLADAVSPITRALSTQVGHDGTSTSRQWLAHRGVAALAVFPLHMSGNASAPERWAGLGAIHPIAVSPFRRSDVPQA